MKFLPRRRSKDAGSPSKSEQRAEKDAADKGLEEWISVRKGVEIYVEPQTSVTGTTMLFVAHDGEFTRRPVRDEKAAMTMARAMGLPVYEAEVVGYPQRMRDYSRKQSILRKRALRDNL